MEAELSYVARPKLSYGAIAKRYKVAKSTVVRHAVKHEWPEKRAKYQKERIKLARKLTAESQYESDDRHLKRLQLIQTVIHNDFMRIAIKQEEGREVTHQEMQRLFGHITPMTKAIMAERAILGLPTKVTRITDPEQIIEYTRAMNGPTPAEQYAELREIEVDLDKLIEYKKRIQRLRNQG